MKKFLVILLMALALTSCGGSDLSSVLTRISTNQATDAKLFEKAMDSITKIGKEYGTAAKNAEARALVDQGIEILLAVNAARRAWLVDVQKAIAKDDADIVREAVTRNDAKIMSLPTQIAQAYAYFSRAKELEGLSPQLTEFQ